MYPHNQFGRPVRPTLMFDVRRGQGNGPEDVSWVFHQKHVWLSGQNPLTVEFIDVAWVTP